jgi:hypothetical protein
MKPLALHRFMAPFGCPANGCGAIAGSGIAVNGLGGQPDPVTIKALVGVTPRRPATRVTVMDMGAAMIAGVTMITMIAGMMIAGTVAGMMIN